MQGFNRYIPPEFDPKHNSTLNSHQGKKHALGKRAKDIDKGILVVRFELPFNIWCGTCNAHLGAGVRYNAQKKKVGNYYSTPIFAFRCKCHLCSGWFEVRTDPKNAAYEVTEGATRKDEDWNPAENGGFAVHDTEAPSAAEPAADPFAGLEKTIDQQTWAKSNTSRLTELTQASARISADPYAVSVHIRRRFREEKRVMLEKQGRDDDLRERYGLAEEVQLGEEDVERGREVWEAARERRGLPIDDVSGGTGAPVIRRNGNGNGKGKAVDLAQVLRKTTTRKYDPFGEAMESVSSPGPIRTKGRIKDPIVLGGLAAGMKSAKVAEKPKPASHGLAGAGGLLAGYGSD
ncbi:hypothetical protein BCR39DRAFT_585776 [Naematelia encephala]|uniref:CWC16 protein n=1 Tax=Naematelia encephala TaxID=71784 RepID=A0A1Y2BJ82_9TREE|nr:hypothetical protein BCR39DRAFT_585776 [Naematelia encephala]